MECVELNISRVSAANEWDIELNMGREINQATLYHFVYCVNISLTRRTGCHSFMVLNKVSDVPAADWPPQTFMKKKITVRLQGMRYRFSQRWKSLWSTPVHIWRSGVSVADMVNIYCAVIRSVVEYASPVFSGLPAFLCCALERMQKRALSIILPGVSYQEALYQSGLAPLEVRRAESCVNFMKSVKSGNPLLPMCEGLLVNNESKYNLRHQP